MPIHNTPEDLQSLYEKISSNHDLINIPLLKLSDNLRPLAFLAVKEENIELLKIFIQQDKELLSVHSKADGDTLLLRACKFAKIEAVKCLLASGANPNLANPDGNTPAMIAVDLENKHYGAKYAIGYGYINGYYRTNSEDYDFNGLEILKLLKEYKANFSLSNNKGNTVLIEAINAHLPTSTQFIMDDLKVNGTLNEQLNRMDDELKIKTLLLGAEIAPTSNITLKQIIEEIGYFNISENLPSLLKLISSNKNLIDIEVLKLYDCLRPLAFLAVKEENIELLKIFIQKDKELLSIHSKADDDTLLLRACKLLKAEAAKCLLENGANPDLTNSHGNTPAMSAMYKQNKYKGYDLDSLKILKLLKQFGADFTKNDNDGDTVLIEAVRTWLPYSSNFIMNTLEKEGILREQLFKLNNKNLNAHDLILSLGKEVEIYSPKYNQPDDSTILEHLISKIHLTGQYNSTIETQIKNLLLKVDQEVIDQLPKKVFITKLGNPSLVPDMLPHNNKSLVKGNAMNEWTEKFFTSKDISLLKLLTVAGANISNYKEFITNLNSISKVEAHKNLNEVSSSVVLTEHQQEILELIKVSDCLSKFKVTETNEISSLVKELAIQKFCFLIQRDTLGIDEKEQINALANFIQDNCPADYEELLPYFTSKDGTPSEHFSNYVEQISKITSDFAQFLVKDSSEMEINNFSVQDNNLPSIVEMEVVSTLGSNSGD